jgi:sarcosine oxidase subunit gamma
MADAQRIGPWSEQDYGFGKQGRFRFEPLPQLARFIFRGSEAAAHDLGLEFGVELSRVPMRGYQLRDASEAGRAALWLGPDEWELIAPVVNRDEIEAMVARVVIEPHSLVDISHRNTAALVSGSKVEAVLNAGVPLDLDITAFPINMSTRTLFGKVEIVLWRWAADCFFVEFSRSYAPYVHAFMSEAAREYLG